MNQVDRLEKVVSQLIGDIAQLPGVTLDKAGEAQLGQLITDAFEQVGHIALSWVCGIPGCTDTIEHSHVDYN